MTCTAVPAGRCTEQEVVVEPPLVMQFIVTAIPPFRRAPQATPFLAILPIYPVATVGADKYGDTLAPFSRFTT